MHKFILFPDFNAIATSDDLEVLSSDNIDIIEQCNAIAIDEAAAYLSVKYDLSQLFLDPVEYDSAETYAIGDRIYTIVGTPASTYTHYTCIKVAPAGTAITNTEYFTQSDSRDRKLLQVVMAISLFYIHQRLSPNLIPEFRAIAYDGNGDDKIMSAIKWLTMIQSGALNPYNWPLITGEDIDGDDSTIGDNPGNGILWGNDEDVNNFWYNWEYPKNIIE